jgi:hypothetical protein
MKNGRCHYFPYSVPCSYERSTTLGEELAKH